MRGNLNNYQKQALEAAKQGDIQKISNLAICNSSILNSPINNFGSKVLHIAAEKGHINVVQYLLENCQVDVNKPDNIGKTALHYAAQNGCTNVVKYLLENCQVDVNQQNKFDETALHIAAGMGKFDVVQNLVENNADINQQDNSGKTALHCAAEKLKHFIDDNNVEIIKFLIRKRGNPSIKDESGKDVFDYVSDQEIRSTLIKFYEEHKKSQTTDNKQPIAATSRPLTQQANPIVRNNEETKTTSINLSDEHKPLNQEQKGSGSGRA